MKISGINLKNEIKLSSKTTKIDKIPSINQQSKFTTCPLSSLQAYNNISFGISNPSFYLVDKKNQNVRMVTSRITLDSGKLYKLNFDSELIDGYLLDENGGVDKQKLDGFVSIYKTILQGIVDEDSKQRDFLTSIVNGKEKSPTFHI